MCIFLSLLLYSNIFLNPSTTPLDSTHIFACLNLKEFEYRDPSKVTKDCSDLPEFFSSLLYVLNKDSNFFPHNFKFNFLIILF